MLKNKTIMKRLSIILMLFCLLATNNQEVKAQGYKLPNYTKIKLDNGLSIYLMEQRDVPVISVSAILPAGAIYDGKQSGLSQLTASTLKHGTKNFSKKQIDEQLDFVGATIQVSASKEYVSLSSKFASKDKENVLLMVKEVLTEPVFDQEEFEKEKSRKLVELEQRKESPRSVIRDHFDKLLFGDHVYGNALSGSQSTVEKLTLDDVKRFYNANYLPNKAALSVVGDFDLDEMKNTLEALFADWTKEGSQQKNLALESIKNQKDSNVLLVNKEDATETTFYIGAPGVSRNSKDLVSIQVINTLFGGRFTSMLNDALRINSGLTYGAGSRFVNYKNGGSFYIGTFTATQSTEEAIDMAFDVLNKLHAGIDQKALTSAKNYVKGQFPPRYETNQQLSNLLVKMFWYDFDESFINDFESNVDGLTLEKSKKIIANYFPVDTFQMVLIGKSSEIEKIANKYGTVKKVDIKD